MREILGRKIFIPTCLIALVVAFLPALAQTASTSSMPTVDQIIEKHVQAMGGKTALEKLNSRVAKGTFVMDQFPGEASEEIYEKAPNKQLTITDAPSFGVVKRGFNGTVGWQDMPQTGLQDITGQQLGAMKRYSDFYRDIKLKELYPKMTVKGKEAVNGKDAYVIEAIPDDGPAEIMYFDVDSGLLVQLKTEGEGPNGKVNIESTFDGYREVDGVKVPCLIHQSFGEFSFTIKLTDVKHNVEIDDAKFDKPAAQ